MSLSVAAITVDCANADVVGTFWSQALDRPLITDQAPSQFFTRIDAGPSGPPMMFIAVPEGRTVKNRVHLDLAAEDRDAEVERLTSLGARIVGSYEEWGTAWTTMQDPEGNEFCVSNRH
ncbi:VOC family protein [Euzebya tangerina]|uniref:VOC family protein n=1 Tax=Euzebya tangerina TaxID=591198 RepID=UPI000E315994|nr:VOC family protein [Euzebya tangerina]